MWTPTPEPIPDVNPGLGWSLDGVNAPAIDPVQGWFVKKQLLALMESSAEFRAGIKAILTGQHTAQAYSTAAIVAHLVGLAPSSSLGSGEGEELDALVKAYLTGWVNTLGTFTARGAFSPKGTYPAAAVFTGGLHVSLGGTAFGQYSSAAEAFAHLAGSATATASFSAAAAYGVMDPVVVHYTAVGIYNYTVPSWSRYVDVVGIGGGGGGGAGNGGANIPGEGGGAGTWLAATWYTGGSGVVVIDVGAGGTGGQSGSSSGTAGARTLIGVGINELPCPGGAAGRGSNASGRDGKSPGNFTAYGETFVGGIGAPGGGSASIGGSQPANTATAPGAGGPGGWGGIFTSYQRGGPGSRGEAWIRIRQ
ncbi:minor tail protein [Gordonia phage Sukkupi]|uniref:Minor tail protein n=1 Tax=Gordonia phage Sukkupi TaxID=2653747 RepID=A0A5Q2WNY7_9CAUD|nr:minor tail protein [Gordonia phage Sukkupi]QGH79289.1 minor tail protein [Gordonia phage Sukkupi]QGH80762.1 minor tail protein [Gordonia phage Yndexa]